jgi:hypothetical protein
MSQKPFLDVSLWDAGYEMYGTGSAGSPNKFAKVLRTVRRRMLTKKWLTKKMWDKPVDWKKQYEAGARLAFIKAYEYVADPAFLMQWAAARQAGMILGAYDFFHPKVNAIQQAQAFISLIKQAGGLRWTGDKRTSDKIFIDLETADGMSGIDVLMAAGSWLYEVEKAFPQYEIGVYTGTWFWVPIGGTSPNGAWAKKYPLWFSAYPLDPWSQWQPAPFGRAKVQEIADAILAGKYKAVPLSPWTDGPTYRQFTAWADSREVPGHPAIKKVVDVNISMIDIPDLSPAPVVIPDPVPVILTTEQRLALLEKEARAHGWVV